MSLLTPKDILPNDVYGPLRAQKRQEMTELKKHRRVLVGPYVIFCFENKETMWHQVQEMLYIEKGGDAQLADELAAYNPLIPQGKEWVTTMLIAIDHPEKRSQGLAQLGSIETHISLQFGTHTVQAVPENDVERTTAEGKTSAVHFLKFHFSSEEIALLRTMPEVILKISHPRYAHAALLSQDILTSLLKDLS